jgi:glycosyltransferase involved in cell wall biosynthesis
VAIWYIHGLLSLRTLAETPTPEKIVWPMVTLIIPVRNEEKDIKQTIRSLFKLKYPSLEFLVVNDRSTDGTQQELERLALEDSRLRIEQIHELPKGWIGKAHALHTGGLSAFGEYLVFVDAGVELKVNALSVILEYMLENDLDHLTIMPRLTMKSWSVQLVANAFLTAMGVLGRPLTGMRPYRQSHSCLGMCQAIRAEAYRKMGGYSCCQFNMPDDVQFGKAVRNHGFSQDLVLGRRVVSNEWYSSFGGFVKNFENYVFPFLDYKLSWSIAISVTLFTLLLLLLSGIVLCKGFALCFMISIYMFYALLYGIQARLFGTKGLLGLFFPVGAFLLVYVLLRSTWIVLARGGIYWRDTFYDIDSLKKSRGSVFEPARKEFLIESGSRRGNSNDQ